MATFTYPSSFELEQVAQAKLPRLQEARLGLQIMPMRNVDSHILRWDQKDNYIGLQQARGLNGEPTRVKRVGGKTYQMEPGVYGEFVRIDEIELTTRRQWGTVNTPISIDDLVMEAQDDLLQRRLDRVEQIIWNVLQGTFSVTGPTGAVIHTDTYTVQTFSAGVTWATTATAVPLQNFRSVQLLSRGYSVNFGVQAQAIMNRSTFNNLVANTNSADLFGKRTTGLATVLGLKDINMVLGNEDLPQIVIYDEGYYDDASAFQLFVPNNKVIVVGQRPAGQVIGEYRMTRNANNQNMAPGAYQKVFDRGETEVPRTIEVHDGHNGGPVIYFGSAIVVMTV
jgi:hypothetical protein